MHYIPVHTHGAETSAKTLSEGKHPFFGRCPVQGHKLCRNGVKNEICKDLKSLGVDLTPEELERLNDESEYPEGYVEAILRAEGIN